MSYCRCSIDARRRRKNNNFLTIFFPEAADALAHEDECEIKIEPRQWKFIFEFPSIPRRRNEEGRKTAFAFLNIHVLLFVLWSFPGFLADRRRRRRLRCPRQVYVLFLTLCLINIARNSIHCYFIRLGHEMKLGSHAGR